jgi:hypothetical protein
VVDAARAHAPTAIQDVRGISNGNAPYARVMHCGFTEVRRISHRELVR